MVLPDFRRNIINTFIFFPSSYRCRPDKRDILKGFKLFNLIIFIL